MTPLQIETLTPPPPPAMGPAEAAALLAYLPYPDAKPLPGQAVHIPKLPRPSGQAPRQNPGEGGQGLEAGHSPPLRDGRQEEDPAEAEAPGEGEGKRPHAPPSGRYNARAPRASGG